MEAFLDVCIAKCPSCNTPFAEASWYALSLDSDLECGKCGTSFGAKSHSTDRVLVRFELDKRGKAMALGLRRGKK